MQAYVKAITIALQQNFFLTLSKCLKSSRAEQLQNQIYNFPSSKPKEAGNSLKALFDRVEYFSSS